MPYEVSKDESRELTIITITGRTNFKEMREMHAGFYENEPTKNLLIDSEKSSWEFITSKQLQRLVDYLKRHRHKRPEDAKTAFVVSGTLEFGLSRMHQILSEIGEISLETEIFYSLDEALNWLKQ